MLRHTKLRHGTQGGNDVDEGPLLPLTCFVQRGNRRTAPFERTRRGFVDRT